ncbi:phosphohexose mutase family protein [Salininema proteolyticum]|uniref:Alpha-D-phosphohexomutase alpha/beta/alpha domain-containing protein n=1 Tax=Salininema proteolyticum TaxID=1607685 RepID=A0ABV8U337_9ACTN
MDDIAGLRTAIFTWITDDPDPGGREELYRLLDRLPASAAELRDRFAAPHCFHGPLRAGPNGINLATVRATAAALAKELSEDDLVLVGYDDRPRGFDLALEAARTLTGAGARAVLFGHPVTSPYVSHEARARDAVAVLITGGLDDPSVSGVRVVNGPSLRSLSLSVQNLGPLTEIPQGPVPRVSEPEPEEYLASQVRLVDPYDPKIIPFHSSSPLLASALEEAGFGPFTEAADAELLLDLAPDGSSCTASVRDDEEWRELSPADLALLLADHWRRKEREGSYVSDHGLIRGFSTGDAPVYRFATGPRLRHNAFGSSPDGLAAALVLTEVAAGMAAQLRTVLDRLDELAAEHGVHLTSHVEFDVPPSECDMYLRRIAKCDKLLDAPVTRSAGDGMRLTGPGFSAAFECGPSLSVRLEVREEPVPDLPVARERARASVEALSTEITGLLGIA